MKELVSVITPSGVINCVYYDAKTKLVCRLPLVAIEVWTGHGGGTQYVPKILHPVELIMDYDFKRKKGLIPMYFENVEIDGGDEFSFVDEDDMVEKAKQEWKDRKGV